MTTNRTTSGRRGHGEDSVYLDADTGRWCAVVSLGRKADGRRDRRKVTAKTKAEALAKFRDLRRRLDHGLPAAGRLTVGAYLDGWAAGLDVRVRPNTCEQYRVTIRCHLRPSLGAKTLTKLSAADCDALWSAKLAGRGRSEHRAPHACHAAPGATRRRTRRAGTPELRRPLDASSDRAARRAHADDRPGPHAARRRLGRPT